MLKNIMKKFTGYRLELTVLISGACVMILEITGSRVVAPTIGNSVYVWTSLIGVVLLSLSLGYWYGGKLADKKADHKLLSRVLLIASLFVLLTYFVNSFLQGLVSPFIKDIRVEAVIYGILLFGPATFLMGIVSPYATKLKLKKLDTGGTVVGRMYALSTAGSVLGTFLAGFFLFSLLKTSTILLLVALVLFVLSQIVNFTVDQKIFMFFILFGMMFFIDNYYTKVSASEGFVDTNTSYNRILIQDSIDKLENRLIRSMKIDSGTFSAMYLDEDFNTQRWNPVMYINAFTVLGDIVKEKNDILLIGGGALSFPRNFVNVFPDVKIDVVEIDKGQVDIARDYFGYEDDPKINIFYEDGRSFINNNEKKYDYIAVDVFNAVYSIPFHLTTAEYLEKISNSLSEGGIFAMNMVSTLEGEESAFLKSFYSTMKPYFNEVVLVTVSSPIKTESQNIIVMGSNSSEPYITQRLDEMGIEYIVPESFDHLVLTDDFAPVDKLLRPIIENWPFN
jgi:spermidine synthase